MGEGEERAVMDLIVKLNQTVKANDHSRFPLPSSQMNGALKAITKRHSLHPNGDLQQGNVLSDSHFNTHEHTVDPLSEV